MRSGSVGCHCVLVGKGTSNDDLSLLRAEFDERQSGSFVQDLASSIGNFRCHDEGRTRTLRQTELLGRRTRRLERRTSGLNGPWGGDRTKARPPQLFGSLLFLHTIFFLRLTRHNSTRPLLSRLPSVKDLMMRFSTSYRMQRHASDPMTLRNLSACFRRRTRILVVRRIIVFKRRPINVTRCPCVLTRFFRFNMRLLRPCTRVIVICVRSYFVFLVVRCNLSVS